MNIDWIHEFIKNLPEISPTKKNLIQIAGYPNWENVNSNFLAFYFDENEEHGLKRLFFDSLIDLLIEKKLKVERNIFNSNYTVDREVKTIKGGRIDLLLKSENSNYEDTEGNEDFEENGDWAIVIENKIYAKLYNDLKDYWKSARAKVTFGVVLSVKNINIAEKPAEPKIRFVNILHKDLVEKVQQNLSQFYLKSNDVHLLFLKEYITNVNSHYKHMENEKEMDETLRKFYGKGEDIKKIVTKNQKLLEFLFKIVGEIMTDMEFQPTKKILGKKIPVMSHFVFEKKIGLDLFNGNEEYIKKFRFWIDIGRLRYSDNFKAVFELYRNDKNKEISEIGDALKSRLEKKNFYASNRGIDTIEKHRSETNFYQILRITIPIDFEKNPEKSYKEALSDVIKTRLFKIIAEVIQELKDMAPHKESTGGEIADK